MISSLIGEVVAFGSNLTVLAVGMLVLAALANQNDVIGESALTWVGVVGVGFIAGRLFGPKLVDRATQAAVGAVSQIPFVGDLVVGVVA